MRLLVFWLLVHYVESTLRSKTSHLLLHQVFELCDLLCVFRMAGDVLLIKEGLNTQEPTEQLWRHYHMTKAVTVSNMSCIILIFNIAVRLLSYKCNHVTQTLERTSVISCMSV